MHSNVRRGAAAQLGTVFSLQIVRLTHCFSPGICVFAHQHIGPFIEGHVLQIVQVMLGYSGWDENSMRSCGAFTTL